MKEKGCYSLNQSRNTVETLKHDRDAGKNKNTEFLDVLLPGFSKKMLWVFLTHSKFLPPQFTEPPPLDLCIIPVTKKYINNCTHDRRHQLPGQGSEKSPAEKKRLTYCMSAAGFKKRCKVIDCNNPTQYTVVQISGICCLHNMLWMGLTFKLSLQTVDSVWDENEVFFPGVILTIPDIHSLFDWGLPHTHYSFPCISYVLSSGFVFPSFYPDESGCRGSGCS